MKTREIVVFIALVVLVTGFGMLVVKSFRQYERINELEARTTTFEADGPRITDVGSRLKKLEAWKKDWEVCLPRMAHNLLTAFYYKKKWHHAGVYVEWIQSACKYQCPPALVIDGDGKEISGPRLPPRMGPPEPRGKR